jgi:pyroglutamyl-peptidase
VNPTETLVRRIAADPPPGIALATLVLPVAWDRAFAAMAPALEARRPDAVLLLGLAANRDRIEFERFAVNWRSAVLTDEDGTALAGTPIEHGGPAAMIPTADVDALAAAAAATGAPAGTSCHAGTFLCNDTLYRTLRWFERRRAPCAVAFCHLPPVADSAQASQGLGADVAERAVRAALDCLSGQPEPMGPRGRYAPESSAPGDRA